MIGTCAIASTQKVECGTFHVCYSRLENVTHAQSCSYLSPHFADVDVNDIGDGDNSTCVCVCVSVGVSVCVQAMCANENMCTSR